MKRKMISMIIAGMVTLASICGCGAGGSQEIGNSDEVHVAYLFDMSGDMAMPSMGAAISMAVDDINAAGGVLGKTLVVDRYDGASNVQTYQDMTKQILNDSDAVVTFVECSSACREAVRNIYEEEKELMIYTPLYEGGVASEYTVCTSYTPDQSTKMLLQYAKDNNLGNSIYFLAADYNYGHIMETWFSKYAKELGFEIAGIEFCPMETSNFSSTVTNIISADPDIIITQIIGSNMMSFYEQWYSAGRDDIAFLVGNGLSGGELETVSAEALENIYTIGSFFEGIAVDGEAKSFVDRFKTYDDKNSISDVYTSAYYSMLLWAEACEKAGSFDTDKVIEAINSGSISCDNGFGGTVTIDGPSHHTAMDMYLIQIQSDKEMKLISTYEDVNPSFLQSLGIDLTVSAPNEQYSPS